jgi:serine/threonine-protein kinase
MTTQAETKTTDKMHICCYHCEQKLDVSTVPPFEKVACPSCSSQIIVPKWFDSYLLEEKCGAGGVANVYRAMDLTLDRQVAIKISKLNEETSEFTEIFLHEGRIAAKLNHSGIVPIYSCGEHDGKCFLVMQYMDGGTIKDKIRQSEELKISQVLNWITDITSALKAAFDNDVIHHDVKPANMLLDSEGNVKIGDFGLAYALNDVKSQDLLDELSAYGSPDYISPEKLIHEYEDHKGDIFSLGVSFYELLTGSKPFKHPDIGDDILTVRKSSQVVPPNKMRPEVSIKLSKFVMRMLDPCPGLRPEYSEILATLSDFKDKYQKHESKKLYRFVAKYL